MAKYVKILVCASVFFTLNIVCKKLTDNFSVNHLVKPADKDSRWRHLEEPENLNKTLAQKYRYLGKGRQAHVFVSEDNKYVLKLLKPLHPHFTVTCLGRTYPIGVSHLPFAQTIFSWFHKKEELVQRDKDFQSYVNSFNLLKEETGIEYLHLTETNNLNQKIELYDKIGVLHTIDLDKTCFILQKKAELLYPILGSLIHNQEIDKAKILIDEFVHLSFQFIHKEILDPTTIERNFGCINFKPVQIDVGRVLRPQDLNRTDVISTDRIYSATRRMRKWLMNKDPLLRDYLEETIEAQKKQALSREAPL